MDDAKQNLKSTAHHEAGHAVADVRFGFSSFRVTIRPDPETGTLGRSWPMDHPADASDHDNYLIVLCAGYASEIKFAPGTEAVSRIGADNDLEKVHQILNKREESGTEIHWISKAKLFVDDNWNAIRAVADELLSHEELDFDEVELIVEHSDTGSAEVQATLATYRALKNAV